MFILINIVNYRWNNTSSDLNILFIIELYKFI